ncbi:MAG: hypothetical protein HY774_13715 [Acidobacteria bacterium]|nr:hypothetical protein [Acidobacteriota bacterium]
MTKLMMVAVILMSWGGSVLAQTEIKLPKGKSVLVDGQVSAGEWDDATEIKISDQITLAAKASGDFIFFAVKYPKPTYFGVDLYVNSVAGQLVNLHASAKPGERELRDGKWPDWTWWNNQGWMVNTSRGVIPFGVEGIGLSAKGNTIFSIV